MKCTYREIGPAAEVNTPDPRTQTRDAFILLGCLLLAGAAAFGGALIAVDSLVGWVPPQTEARIFSGMPFEELLPFPEQDSSGRAGWTLWVNTLERLRPHPAVLPLAYRLVLVQGDQPNAFAIPGGTIAVTTALVDAAGDDPMAVSMILGHELGHFAHRDHLRGLGRAAVLGLVLSALLGSDLGTLGRVALNLETLRYSRRQERLADLFGARVTLDTFGDISSFTGFLGQIAEQEALPRWAYMLSTHPDPKERIRTLETFAQTYRSE